MNILRIFKRSPKSQTSLKRDYNQIDNIGTMQDTYSKASAYWLSRTMSQKIEPFVLYLFETEQMAVAALLENKFIKIAKDTKRLICIEPFVFGTYGNERGEFEAVIAGSDLTLEMWNTAKENFIKMGGKVKNEQPPENKKRASIGEKSTDLGKVVHLNTTKNPGPFGVNTYEIYRGPNSETAKAFLKKKNVSQRMYYIIVETPEGNYGKDIDGIYKE